MSERLTVAENLTLSYSGLVDIDELFKLIDEWFRYKGYDKVIVKHREYTVPKGRRVEMQMTPYKKTTDYLKNEINIWLDFDNIQDVEIKKGNKTIRINKADIFFNFDAFIDMDYEGKWEQKAILFFLRTLVDKFIHKAEIDKYQEVLAEELNELIEEINSFLNLYKVSPAIRARRPSEYPYFK